MNLQSEIDYFSELAPVEQARLLALFMHEFGIEARTTYGAGPGEVTDGTRMRFCNEMMVRIARYV